QYEQQRGGHHGAAPIDRPTQRRQGAHCKPAPIPYRRGAAAAAWSYRSFRGDAIEPGRGAAARQTVRRPGVAKLRVGVLISGRGSNLQALIEAAADPAYPAEIALVISNRAEAQGLQRAE